MQVYDPESKKCVTRKNNNLNFEGPVRANGEKVNEDKIEYECSMLSNICPEFHDMTSLSKNQTKMFQIERYLKKNHKCAKLMFICQSVDTYTDSQIVVLAFGSLVLLMILLLFGVGLRASLAQTYIYPLTEQ